MIEWDGRWKVTAYAVARASADVIVSGYVIPHQDSMGVAIVNDQRQGWQGVVEVQVRRWSDGRVMGGVKRSVTAPPQSATVVLQSSVTALLSSTECRSNTSCFVWLRAELSHSQLDGRMAAANVTLVGWVFLAPLKLAMLPEPHLHVLVREVTVAAAALDGTSPAAERLQVEVSSSAPAAYVVLETPLLGVWSDNGYLLLPDAPRVLTFTSWAGPITAQQLRANLTAMHTQLTIMRE